MPRASQVEISDLGMNLFFDREAAGLERFGSATWRRISARAALGRGRVAVASRPAEQRATLEAAGRPRRPDAPGAGDRSAGAAAGRGGRSGWRA
ncbi:hypothetical protein ACPA9J_29480 [Pseudomonas aeruginosa]